MLIHKKNHALALAITIYLLAGIFTPAGAAPIQSTSMVNTTNNLSDSTTPYEQITVTQNSPASSFLIGTDTVFVGVGQNTATPLVVYMTTPVSGIYNVVVSNNGSTAPGNVSAVGTGSINPGAVTIHGPLAAKVTASGLLGTSAGASALGMAVGFNGTSLVTDAVTLSVTATGGTSDTNAKANTQGITVGNDNPASTIFMGTANGINNINVLAKGGSAASLNAGAGTNVSANAYGISNNNVITIYGNTYIYATAESGAPVDNAHYAGSASTNALGLFNDGGTVYADSLTIGNAKAISIQGAYVDSYAYGLRNSNGGYISAGNLRLEEISAKAGSTIGIGTSEASAIGIDNQKGSVTAGSVYAQVMSTGGTNSSGSSSTAIGLRAGENIDGETTTILGKDNGSNEIHVTANGGASQATNTSGAFISTAYGLLNNNAATLKGITSIDILATGGTKTTPNAIVGNGYATAYGIYNKGSSLSTGNLSLDKVRAQAIEGLDAHATAYGFYNEATGASITLGNVDLINISSQGGQANPGGIANALAYGFNSAGSGGLIIAEHFTGTMTAQGGTNGAFADTSAMGIINNSSNLNATSINLNVTSNAGAATISAFSQAAGIVNNGILSLTSGSNYLKVKGTAGTSTGPSGNNYSVGVTGVSNGGNMNFTGPLTMEVEATAGGLDNSAPGHAAVLVNAQAIGFYNNPNSQLFTNQFIMKNVKASGGTDGQEAQAQAIGFYNNSNQTSVAGLSLENVEAVGGRGTNHAFANVAGIVNENNATLVTTDATAANIIKAVATAGTISGTNSATEDASATTFGINNANAMTIKGSLNITTIATGGNGNAKDTSATSTGIKNKSSSSLNILGPLTISATAQSPNAGSLNSKAEALGIHNLSGTTNIKDNLKIITLAESINGKPFKADALYATGGTINAGTDGITSLGKIVQLEGDVKAENSGTTINITLDQPTSYLQGNVQEVNSGSVNLIVGNMAIWQPVYGNYYGTFSNENDPTTLTKNLAVAANTIPHLTLNDGGIVDLAWDNQERDPSLVARTLNIGRLAGNNGTFKINSDLAHNVADKLSISATAINSTNAYIQVAYDPYLAQNNLQPGKSINGKAEVVSLAPDTLNFTGKQGEYNTYKYTPTVVKDPDDKWYLTSLVINNDGSDTGPVKTIAQANLGLQELWLAETNSLEERLGELRANGPDVDGVWARYNHGKLEHNNTSLKYNLFQVGFDKKSTGTTENTYRGLALSHAKGSGSYEIGSGDVKETTFSLYQTGIKKSGHYYDVILKAGRYSNEYDLVSVGNNKASADYHTWAYSISGEYGVRKQLGRGYYVEPQAELILGRIQGADYVTSTNMKAKVDAQNKAIARLGVAAGKEFKNGNFYGKVNFFHDFSGNVQIKAADNVNNVFYTEDVAHNWCELALGGTIKIGKSSLLYGELSKNIGQLTSGLQINVGARWTF